MPRRRGSRKKTDDAFVALLGGILVVALGAVVVTGVSAFWGALVAGDPAAIVVIVALLLAIGGGSAFLTYRFVKRRERKWAAKRAADEYLHWLRTADMAALDQMSGIEFELALEQLFRDLGYGAAVTQASHDYGADLLLSRGGQRVVVQAKRYVGTLGLDAVQQASAARLHYAAVRALVVTTSDFTAPARALALSTGVELWDRQRLNEELATAAKLRSIPTQPQR